MEVRESGIMIDSIEKAIIPFHVVACFLGFGVVKHNLDYLRLCFNIFYILAVWIVYGCTVYYMVTFFDWNRMFIGYLMVIIITTNLLITVISVIINILNHKKLFMCIRNLSLIDDTLEQLGTPKEYYKIRNLIKWIFSAWFIVILILWAIDAFWAMKRLQDKKAIFLPLLIHYPFYLISFMNVTLIFHLRCIGTRLNKINDYVGQLSETKYKLRCTRKTSLVTRHYVRRVKNRERILWTAMHLHLELCRIARNINNFYGVQITSQMISYFVFLTGSLYFQYRTALCLKQNWISRENSVAKIESNLMVFVHGNIWGAIFLTKLVALNYICETVVTKAEKTKDKIYELTNVVYFDQIREDIYQFVLQILLQPLKFNGMGLFYFGYKFLFKFIVGIVSIVIFMMQMDTSPLSRILIYDESNATCYE